VFSGISRSELELICMILKGSGLQNSVLSPPCLKSSTTPIQVSHAISTAEGGSYRYGVFSYQLFNATVLFFLSLKTRAPKSLRSLLPRLQLQLDMQKTCEFMFLLSTSNRWTQYHPEYDWSDHMTGIHRDGMGVMKR